MACVQILFFYRNTEHPVVIGEKARRRCSSLGQHRRLVHGGPALTVGDMSEDEAMHVDGGGLQKAGPAPARSRFCCYAV